MVNIPTIKLFEDEPSHSARRSAAGRRPTSVAQSGPQRSASSQDYYATHNSAIDFFAVIIAGFIVAAAIKFYSGGGFSSFGYYFLFFIAQVATIIVGFAFQRKYLAWGVVAYWVLSFVFGLFWARSIF